LYREEEEKAGKKKKKTRREQWEGQAVENLFELRRSGAFFVAGKAGGTTTSPRHDPLTAMSDHLLE
jgi:hypothetical protein